MNSFENLHLNPNIIHALNTLSITEPTSVQQESIPAYFNGGDLIVQAQTGSGKTYAYLCPLVQSVDYTTSQMQALILAPTHELVMQIKNTLQELCTQAQLPLKCQPLIGEANINKQIEKLKEKPHILIGTPGRVLDLFKKRKLNGQTIKTIILDEADNLLDNTNRQSVLDVIKSTQRDRRLLAYSASYSEGALSTLRDVMNAPAFVNISQNQVINPAITHYYLICEERDKFELLRKLIVAVKPSRALIFQHNGARIDLTAEKLTYHKLKAHALYSALDKEERQKAMNDFRQGKISLMVSSDLSARGLDIPAISHVINLDFPQNPNEYIHRAGRTARGGNSGVCISIITPKESAAVRILQREFHIDMKCVKLLKGQLIETTPQKSLPKKKEDIKNVKSASAQKKAAQDKKTLAQKGAPKRLKNIDPATKKETPAPKKR